MTYEYRCRKCDTSFDVMATLAEKAAGLQPKCPNCGSKQTAQVFGMVGVLSGAGEAGRGRGSEPRPMCGAGMGPGCC
ncbi:MAG: zinc ribbon domain-containing protein [Spirochaetaceae bacterium]|nr:MAG: zinc ribbon domain-containing protein [Spirochaetaceae bacterium]